MIIVTGGAGFIGSAIVWKLNQLGEDNILVVDNLGTDERWKNLVPLKFHDYMEKDEFIDHVINQRLTAKLRSDREGIEAIIHMGACSSTMERDATFLIRTNFEYTKHLAIAAANEGARFIYASSGATYGDGSNGFVDDEKGIDRLRPLNMYVEEQLGGTIGIAHMPLNGAPAAAANMSDQLERGFFFGTGGWWRRHSDAAGVGAILEAGEFLDERQMDRASRAIALFADNDLGQVLSRVARSLVCFDPIRSRTINKHHDISVLLDGARLAQIGQLRFAFAAPLLDLARQL